MFPKFKDESEEADWWASPAGRAFVKKKSAEAQAKGNKPKASRALAHLIKARSTQIAIRIPIEDPPPPARSPNAKALATKP